MEATVRKEIIRQFRAHLSALDPVADELPEGYVVVERQGKKIIVYNPMATGNTPEEKARQAATRKRDIRQTALHVLSDLHDLLPREYDESLLPPVRQRPKLTEGTALDELRTVDACPYSHLLRGVCREHILTEWKRVAGKAHSTIATAARQLLNKVICTYLGVSHVAHRLTRKAIEQRRQQRIQHRQRYIDELIEETLGLKVCVFTSVGHTLQSGVLYGPREPFMMNTLEVLERYWRCAEASSPPGSRTFLKVVRKTRMGQRVAACCSILCHVGKHRRETLTRNYERRNVVEFYRVPTSAKANRRCLLFPRSIERSAPGLIPAARPFRLMNPSASAKTLCLRK